MFIYSIKISKSKHTINCIDQYNSSMYIYFILYILVEGPNPLPARLAPGPNAFPPIRKAEPSLE